jgi:hypothetical protein
MARKDVGKYSSDELYELARQREIEEQEAQKEEIRAQVAALREEKKAAQSRHKKEIAAIDAQIRALGGRTRGGGKRGGQTGISEAVLQIVSGSKSVDTKTIRAKLDGMGVNTTNLGQTLAYLKRTRRISSESRGVYSASSSVEIQTKRQMSLCLYVFL